LLNDWTIRHALIAKPAKTDLSKNEIWELEEERHGFLKKNTTLKELVSENLVVSPVVVTVSKQPKVLCCGLSFLTFVLMIILFVSYVFTKVEPRW
jgi:hypothetical protein